MKEFEDAAKSYATAPRQVVQASTPQEESPTFTNSKMKYMSDNDASRRMASTGTNFGVVDRHKPTRSLKIASDQGAGRNDHSYKPLRQIDRTNQLELHYEYKTAPTSTAAANGLSSLNQSRKYPVQTNSWVGSFKPRQILKHKMGQKWISVKGSVDDNMRNLGSLTFTEGRYQQVRHQSDVQQVQIKTDASGPALIDLLENDRNNSRKRSLLKLAASKVA